MIGHAFGHVKTLCIDPWMSVYDIARYYYYPKILMINEMAEYGINLGMNDEVVFV